MTRTTVARLAAIFVAPQLFFAAAAPADMVTRDYIYHARFDVTDLTSIDFGLYNNDDYCNDAYVLIGNLTVDGNPWTDFGSDMLPFAPNLVEGNSLVCIQDGFLRFEEGVPGPTDKDNTAVASADLLATPLTARLEFDVHFFGRLSTEDPSANSFWVRLNGEDKLNIDDTTEPPVVPAPGAALLAVVGLSCVGLVRRLRGQPA